MTDPSSTGRDPRDVPTLTDVLDEPPVVVGAGVDVDAEAARFEARLRDIVEPAVARLADALVLELRDEFAARLREALARRAP